MSDVDPRGRPGRWTRGNGVLLLENGEVFFPRVFDAIRGARHEVLIETFILFDDRVGRALRAVLLDAARRGVRVELLVDGFGSPDLSTAFVAPLTEAGASFRVFDPARRLFGTRLNVFRRLHRKIVVVDAMRAFVGGINFGADHLLAYGPTSKQDYAVELTGPIVDEIRGFVRRVIEDSGGDRVPVLRCAGVGAATRLLRGRAEVALVTRDNWRHTSDIEAHYLHAIRHAKRRIVIANAYFFPGYRLIHALRAAARRGVDVRLVLQGQPDMPLVKAAASTLYHHLLMGGVRIYEYCERPLHGKVAVIDDDWATVGSSNLDPLSLSLNLEANVMVRDRAFNRQLHGRLVDLIEQSCVEIHERSLDESSLWRLVRSFFVFHFLRWYPKVGLWLPHHAPRVREGEATASWSGERRALRARASRDVARNGVA